MPKTSTTAQAEKVLTSLCEQYPAEFVDTTGPRISTTYHESGPVIVWEEGPEEWTIHYAQSISASLVSQAEGIFVEPVNHVVLGIYPA